jgi:hypothetical protein
VLSDEDGVTEETTPVNFPRSRNFYQPSVVEDVPEVNATNSSRPSYLPAVLLPIGGKSSNAPTPAQSQPMVKEASITLASMMFNVQAQNKNNGNSLDPQSTSNGPVPKGAQATNITSSKEWHPNPIAVEKLSKTNRLIRKVEKHSAAHAAKRQQQKGTSSDQQPQRLADMPKRALPAGDDAQHPALEPSNKRSKLYSPLLKRKSDISMHDADEDLDSSMTSNASKPVQTTPPTDFKDPPPIEYEDITEEVDARMKATSIRKERQKMKDLGLLGSEKRKRHSGASVEDGGVDIRGGGGSTPSKRLIKKVKKSHRKSEEAAEEFKEKSEQHTATSTPGDVTPGQAAPKHETGAELKRSAEDVDGSADLTGHGNKKKKKFK